MGRQELHQPLKDLSDKINSLIETGSEISIITRSDPDGIASGSITLAALSRLESRSSLRTISTLDSNVIQEIKSDTRDFYILLGLGSGMAEALHRFFGENWTIIDHEEFGIEHANQDYDSQIINPWKYGLDGTREISTGGLCYVLSTVLDKKNTDLSPIAIIAALGDRQDLGDRKALVGMNSEILKTAKSLNLIDTQLDLLLCDREIIPLHESIARTSYPYIHGLTWNVQNAYTIIKNTGIKMKDNDVWRVLSDFTPEEKNIIRDAIAKFVITSSNSSSTEVADNLLGYSYKLLKEDNRSFLRDARDFASLLDACGRTGKAGLGVALCMGDRSTMLTEAEHLAGNYFATLNRFISAIFNEKWRYLDDGMNTVFVNGEGLLTELMLEAVSSLLAGSPSLFGRLLFIRTLSQEDRGNSYRFSAIKCVGNRSQLNVGHLMKECSNIVGGNGGGNDNGAGCIIPSSKLEIFLTNVRRVISNSKLPEFSTASS
jgi:single-stranded-DNA-specific exonuclease